MKISMSSAEFEINSNLNHTLFGAPKYFESGKFVNVGQAFKYNKNNSYVLKYDDIDKLEAWDEYKKEIKNYYNGESTCLQKDIHGQYWVSIGGSGWAYLWTVNLGNYKL